MLLETRKLASETGSRTRLVRVEAMPERGPNPAVSRESFLATIPEFLRATADLLLRRLARIDAEIEFTFAEGAVEIRCGERELCVLEVHDGSLRGEIPALDRSLPIRGMDDADLLLEDQQVNNEQRATHQSRFHVSPNPNFITSLPALAAPYPEPGETVYNMLARIRQVGDSAWWFTFISWLAAAACILNAAAFASRREQVRAMKAEGLVEELRSK
jgi:hypothetical protein